MNPFISLRMDRVSRALGVVFALLLGACGGGGGGGGTGDGPTPPAQPPVTVTLSPEVYPLASGDRRSWRPLNDASGRNIRHERVGEALGAALVVSEITLRSFGSDPRVADDVQYLQRSANGVTAVPGPESDALSRAAGTVELLRFGQARGQNLRLYERTLAVDLDNDGRAESIELRIDSEFVGIEAVTTPAGNYRDAQKVRSVIRTAVRAGGTGTPVVIEQTSDDWYVPGIGPVRNSTSTRTDNRAPELSGEELLAFSVGTRRSEQATPTVTTSVPANGSQSRPDTGLELQFSRPVDPLSLAGANGLRVLRDGQPVTLQGMQLSGDGTSLRLFVRDYPLADGRYELRHDGQVVDWAGNALPLVLNAFQVDVTGPRLLGSSPANGEQEAPLSGRIEFRYDEPLRVLNSSLPLRIGFYTESSNSEQWLPATLEGNRVYADLPSPLRINSDYRATVPAGLTDAQGNPVSIVTIGFRTDPGPFARPVRWLPTIDIDAVAMLDLDSDGRLDLVAAGWEPGVNSVLAVRKQRADGGFDAARTTALPNIANACLKNFASGDLNQDGRMDLVVETCGMPILLLQRSDGGFDSETIPEVEPSGYWTRRTATLGPGRVGLLWSTGQGLRLWQRDGPGQWRASALTGQRFARQASVTDLNSDGRPDLLWVQNNGTPFPPLELAWSLQQANGSWSAVQVRAVPAEGDVTSLTLADVNQDGRLDVVMSARQFVAFAFEIWVMRGTSSNGFESAQRMASEADGAVFAGDVNGDGRTDVVAAHGSRRTSVYLQAADGALEVPRQFEAGFMFSGNRNMPIALVDLNADGRMDIVQGAVVLYGRAQTTPWPAGLSAPSTSPSGALSSPHSGRSKVLRAVPAGGN